MSERPGSAGPEGPPASGAAPGERLAPASEGPASGACAVVVIGRNEGERLRRCLASVREHARRVVYVDSGSTDGSAEYARSQGFEVVELDMKIPFSAARARNEGFARLQELDPEIPFVQFVDGDCEVAQGWVDAALAALRANEDWAIVCGRRRERHPEASVYNRLCDVEWDTPLGEAAACGGDFMIRARIFAEVGGFDPTVIAGEEPELCHRVRGAGYQIFRLDHEMTLHDAAMTRFSQFWKRAERAGYAYALVAALHFRSPRRIWVKQVVSVVAWATLPLGLLALGLFVGSLAALGLLLYPLLWWKTARYFRKGRGLEPSLARLYAGACVIGKFAELRGVLRAARDLALGRPRTIIEYKGLAQRV